MTSCNLQISQEEALAATPGYLQTGDDISDSDADSDEPDLAVAAKAAPGSRNAVPDRAVTEPFAVARAGDDISDSDADPDEPDLAVAAKAVPGSRNAVPDRAVTEPFAVSRATRVRQNSLSGLSGAGDHDSTASFMQCTHLGNCTCSDCT